MLPDLSLSLCCYCPAFGTCFMRVVNLHELSYTGDTGEQL